MKQKFSTIFILLLLFFADSRVVAQNVPKPFDIEQPSLRVFLPAPELATGRAVVACPGGGYSHLAFEHEGCDWAPYFNKQGIALIVLKYRMPNGDRTLPISNASYTDSIFMRYFETTEPRRQFVQHFILIEETLANSPSMSTGRINMKYRRHIILV